ncbi:MAG: hypothetical protein ACK6AD_05005 [Cyanobacteriota bacterium]|jgi:hypothetical protein
MHLCATQLLSTRLFTASPLSVRLFTARPLSSRPFTAGRLPAADVFAASAMIPAASEPVRRVQARRLVLSMLLGAAVCLPAAASATPVNLDLNRALQIGWHSLRVQNPFGTNYTGLTAIKSYNPATKEFVFLNSKGEDVIIAEADISFIYFRQLPDRSDVNVKDGVIGNLQITPHREFLYDVRPGRLLIQEGILKLNSRWRIAEQTPFGVDLRPAVEGQDLGEKIEIPRRIQLNYLGNHYLVETESVNVIVNDRPQPGAGSVPRPVPSPFKVPAPSLTPTP